MSYEQDWSAAPHPGDGEPERGKGNRAAKPITMESILDGVVADQNNLLENRLKNWTPPSLEELLKPYVVEWLIDGWVQHGLAGQLVAEGGTGKTTLLLELAISVATGRPWLGLTVRKTGVFVLVTRDDTQAMILGALSALLSAKNEYEPTRLTAEEMELVRKRVRLFSVVGDPFTPPFAVVDPTTKAVGHSDLTERITKGLEDVENVVCVAFDTQRHFAGGSTNDDERGVIAAQMLTALAADLHCTAIVTAHTGKQQARDRVRDSYSSAGTTAVPDSLRFVMRLLATTPRQVLEAIDVQPVSALNGPDVKLFELESTRGSLLVKPPPIHYFMRHGFLLSAVPGLRKTASQKNDELFAKAVGIIDAATKRGERMSSKKLKTKLGGNDAATSAKIEEWCDKGYLLSHHAGTNKAALEVTEVGRRAVDPF